MDVIILVLFIENKIEEQNVEQGQDLQEDQNDDKTLENIDDDDLNLTETPDNRRAARKGSSGRKTAAVANEFEGKDLTMTLFSFIPYRSEALWRLFVPVASIKEGI